MKTIEEIHEKIQAALTAARDTHEYRAEGASIEFTNAMLTRMRQVGVSRGKLAAKIGVSPAYISKILRGDTNFSLETMVKIANALESEFRCHIQPVGAKAQWLDVYSTRTRKTSFRVTDVSRNIIRPEQFRRVTWQMNTETEHEKRTAIA